MRNRPGVLDSRPGIIDSCPGTRMAPSTACASAYVHTQKGAPSHDKVLDCRLRLLSTTPQSIDVA
jgi:hypothetical protein